jgi:hypothetical protein
MPFSTSAKTSRCTLLLDFKPTPAAISCIDGS